MIDDDVIILTVEDPHSQVGSGGATVNALLVVSEYISARAGHSVNIKALPHCNMISFYKQTKNCDKKSRLVQPGEFGINKALVLLTPVFL